MRDGAEIFVGIKRTAALLAAFAGVLLAGCGPSGPSRYDVSGKVTYKGQPVPTGSIRFEPDTAAGNTGPGAHADIKNGAYHTLSGQGVVGGPHNVTITGTDGIPYDIGAGKTNPQGHSLFSDYSTKVELPKNRTTKDFDVPAN